MTDFSVGLVENNGSDIPGVTPLAVNGADVNATNTTITVGVDKFGDNATDTTTALGRRVKITFSGSTLTTDANVTGAFTVSATPVFGVAGTAYAVVGSSDGGAASGTYERNQGNGNLSITSSGADMHGITLIEFWDNGDGAKVAGTTDLTAADWTVSGDGRSITITKATMDLKGVNWYTADTDRQLRLTTRSA